MTEHSIQVDLGGGRAANVPVELPANSAKSKQTRKKEEKVVTGTVVQRPPSVWKRAKGSLIASDVGESVWQYVVMEVLVPAAKNMMLDAVSQGFERLLYGDIRVRSRADRPSGYVSYNRVRRAQAAEPERYGSISKQARAAHDFDDVILQSRGDAEDVLDRLRDLVAQYEVASVADFYDLVGITSQFTDNEWGWYDLRLASVRHVRGGYQIVLPRTQPIDK